MATIGHTNPILDIVGNWKNGISSIRLFTKMKKNSDTRNGR